jgi:Protein of unknown function (DUF2934)
MQFSKTSKKTRQIAEETAAAPESATPAETSKPRTTRSSKSKSLEASETGSVKHRKAATKPVVAAEPAPVPKPEVMAAATANVAEPSETVVSRPVRREEIAVLAHSYWVARGYAPGSPEQDWLRAERELQARA